MRFLHALVLLLAGLATTQAMAWGNHSLIAYRVFEKMPEVSGASPVTVESLESFLRSEESTLEALLASQEAWALANLENYPLRPAQLAFIAIPARSDEARRMAFLMALRVAANSRFALYFQADAWNAVDAPSMPNGVVNTLPDHSNAGRRYLALKAGEQVTALTVLASACDEPEYGLDNYLWEDSPSDWGRIYGFGLQPFGNPALPQASQATFHQGFFHESRVLYLAAPGIKRTFPLLRSHQFSTLAALAFRTGHAYWGWRFAGLSLYYLQDLTQPYNAGFAPGVSNAKLLSAKVLAKAGLPGMQNDLQLLTSNRQLVLEKFLTELMLRAAARQQETAQEKALHNADKDRSYPDWNDRYLREVVSLQARNAALPLSNALLAALPAAYVSDPGFDFGASEPGISLLSEAGKRDGQERARLESMLAELMGNLGAHSRNALRGVLRESTPL